MTEGRKKKLIEVALPLEEINAASRADKAVKTGSIRNLHKWFAPAPLPAWRALLFAALVDDPVDEKQRAVLLDVIKRLMANGAGLPPADAILDAREVIRAQFPEGLPVVMDPFCGGGSTLVEAQRLGIPTYGSDLNPVPVLLTRTLTDVLPKVHGQPPLHGRTIAESGPGQTAMDVSRESPPFSGYEGLAQDVRHYAEEVRRAAWDVLKKHYPSEQGETPIAWIWVRTVGCPNPACGIETVLSTSWWLSKKRGELAWIEPTVTGGSVGLSVVSGCEGSAPPSPKSGRGTFACLACGATLDDVHLRAEGSAGRMGRRLVAVVAEEGGRRIYRAPTEDETSAADVGDIERSFAEVSLGAPNQYTAPPRYGLNTQADLYVPRQLLALTTLADLVADTHRQVLSDGGTTEWAAAVSTMLGLAVGKLAQYNSTQVFLRTRNGPSSAVAAFGRNDLPMTWDFVEPAIFGESIGSIRAIVTNMLRALPYVPAGEGTAEQVDARVSHAPRAALIATDPPYFDAIGYADLSDYFYVWHRRALRGVHPDLYGTVAAPKSGELTAFPWQHSNSKSEARSYFIEGFIDTFRNLRRSATQDLPMIVIYASKEQQAGKGEETRWESILTAMVAAELEITGAWPIHMTTAVRMRSASANAVASYVVMVCRPREANSSTISLSDFSRALRRELPAAIRDLQASSILPVDLYQAALGPGMRIYSRHRRVEDSKGSEVSVGRALQLITATVSEVLDEQQGELDSASRFAVTWWESFGWNPGPFGEADKIARGYGTHVDDVVRSEVVTAVAGVGVRLTGAGPLDRAWTPENDSKPTAWEAVHHLADRLIDGGGETEAAALMARLGALQDSANKLAYRLHDVAAKKGWAKDQERYNALIGQWSSMLALAATHNPEGLF